MLNGHTDASKRDTASGVEPSTPATRAGLSRRALTRVCTYMEMNLGKRLSLRELAQAAGISRSHFARTFRVSTGSSPMKYLLRLRIERAKAVLLERDTGIADLATELGFCDQSHFCRVFRRSTGFTPKLFGHLFGEYRPAEVSSRGAGELSPPNNASP